MGTNRIHKNDSFTQIANDVVRDSRLSFRARGILIYMLSHVDGWRAGYREIVAAGTEGRQAVLSAFKELEAFGYRRIERAQREDGTWTTETHWYESPNVGKPSAGNPTHGKSARNRTPSKNTMKNTPSSSVADAPSSSGGAPALNWPTYR